MTSLTDWVAAMDTQEFTAVYAVSRHPLDYDVKRTKHIRLDLSDKEAVKQVSTSNCCWHACEPLSSCCL